MPKPKNKTRKHKKKKKGGQQKQQSNVKHKNKPKGKSFDNKNQNKNKFSKSKSHQIDSTTLQTRIVSKLATIYRDYTHKHAGYSSFTAMLTKHNLLQVQLILEHSLVKNVNIADTFSEKNLKQCSQMHNRDINRFMMHGDIAIGVCLTQIQNNEKEINIRTICILPYFQNFGFGSRLLLELIRNCIQRRKLPNSKLQSLTVYLTDNKNEKLIHFFQRFGFKLPTNVNKNSNQMLTNGSADNTNTNANANTKNTSNNTKQQTNKKNSNNKNKNNNKSNMYQNRIKMKLDLKLLEQTLIHLIKKDSKDSKANPVNQK